MNTIQIFSKSRSHGPELEGRDLRTLWAGPLSQVGPWRHPWVGTAQTLLQWRHQNEMAELEICLLYLFTKEGRGAVEAWTDEFFF